MNAFTCPVTLSGYAGRAAGQMAQRIVFGIAVAAGLAVGGTALAREYVVSDLPEMPVAEPVAEGAIIDLPAGELPPDGQGDLSLPGITAEGSAGMPVLPSDEYLGASLIHDGGEPMPSETPLEESGASEFLVTDGWSPVGPLAPPARPQRWTAQIDALFLFMGDVPSRTIYIDDATGQSVLNLNQADPEMSVAPRYGITWHRDACRAFEINYFQVGSFRAVAESRAPTDVFYTSEGLGGVQFNDIIAAGFESTAGIKSWEFNLRKAHGGSITWIAGFRWVEWTQQLAIADLYADRSPPVIPLGFDAYRVATGNNLYGGQLGADLMLWNRGNRLRVNGVAKGGVYYNHQAYQQSTLLGDQAPNFPITTLAATKDTTSFVGEVGLTGEYRITNWLSWRAGYTLFWLGGIATPANQLAISDFNDPPTTGISPYSSVLLHGATTGLEARW